MIYQRPNSFTAWETLPTIIQDNTLLCAEGLSELGQFAVFVEDVTEVLSNDSDVDALPSAYAIHQNHPNPFAGTTTLSFDLPEPAHVQVQVFDMLGRQQKTWIDQHYTAGKHHLDVTASDLPSGTYFYVFQAGTYLASHSMVVIR